MAGVHGSDLVAGARWGGGEQAWARSAGSAREPRHPLERESQGTWYGADSEPSAVIFARGFKRSLVDFAAGPLS